MPETTNTHNYFDGYTADDHDGHTGQGGTPEQAQEALEQAQHDGAKSGVHEAISGVNFTFGSDKDE